MEGVEYDMDGWLKHLMADDLYCNCSLLHRFCKTSTLNCIFRRKCGLPFPRLVSICCYLAQNRTLWSSACCDILTYERKRLQRVIRVRKNTCFSPLTIIAELSAPRTWDHPDRDTRCQLMAHLHHKTAPIISQQFPFPEWATSNPLTDNIYKSLR